VLNHPSKIRANYQPVVHVGSVTQSARILSIRRIPEVEKEAEKEVEEKEADGEGDGEREGDKVRDRGVIDDRGDGVKGDKERDGDKDASTSSSPFSSSSSFISLSSSAPSVSSSASSSASVCASASSICASSSSVSISASPASSIEIGNGDRALCRFRFLYHPEYLMPGEAMIFREQRTTGVGTLTKLL